MFRGSCDSFYISRAGSRSNSIHFGPGTNFFPPDAPAQGPGTPYRGSPIDVPISPYGSNIDIAPLNLDNIVIVPLPSRPQQKQLQSYSAEKSSKSNDSSPSMSTSTRKRDKSMINDLIERFLEEEPISREDWDTVRKEEQIILNCLIKRKLGFDILEYIRVKGVVKEGAVKCKRLEENYKMVFKGALKYLSSNFKEKKAKKKTKAEDIAFYQHYFGSVANDSNPLEAFFHPNKYHQINARKLKANSAKNANNNQKTMNSTYLENLLSSERFRNGLEQYLNTDFINGYKMRRRKKIDNFIDKIKKENFFNQDLVKLTNYLENNPKCKLPWSNKELMAAKNCVMSLIDQHKQ